MPADPEALWSVKEGRHTGVSSTFVLPSLEKLRIHKGSNAKQSSPPAHARGAGLTLAGNGPLKEGHPLQHLFMDMCNISSVNNRYGGIYA